MTVPWIGRKRYVLPKWRSEDRRHRGDEARAHAPWIAGLAAEHSEGHPGPPQLRAGTIDHELVDLVFLDFKTIFNGETSASPASAANGETAERH